MNIIFRVDSSFLIGTGHVYRCLTLAKLIRKHKKHHKITFITKKLPGNINTEIEKRGFETIILPYYKEETIFTNSYSHWLGSSIESDSSQTIDAINKINFYIDLLVVDHYCLDIEWEKQLRKVVRKIMIIDDIANRKHDCDIILDHNFYLNLEERYIDLVPKYCFNILGPENSLINPYLKKIRKKRIFENRFNCVKTVNNILLFLGGSDVTNKTQEVLEEIISKHLPTSVFLDVVLGASNPHINRISKLYSNQTNINIHFKPSYFYKLMYKADVAIGAGGVSQLERMYIGLPTYLLTIAENQKEITHTLIKKKFANSFDRNIDILRETKTECFSINILEIKKIFDIVKC